YTLAANVENATVISGATIAVNLVGNALDNTLIGNDAANTLTGGVGNDRLDGGAGNDTLIGGAGFDVFVAGLGNDSIDGGAITERINYSDSNRVTYLWAGSGVAVDLGAGTATDQDGNTETLVNINFVTGSRFNDTITGSTALVFEQFEGSSGDD